MRNDGPERRKHQRVPVTVPAGIYFKNRPGEVIDAEILDLSEGGAFVHCETPLRLGEEILVEIRFAETSFLEGKTVTHVKEGEFKEQSFIRWARGTKPTGFGIEFGALSPQKRDFLAKLVRHFAKAKPQPK